MSHGGRVKGVPLSVRSQVNGDDQKGAEVEDDERRPDRLAQPPCVLAPVVSRLHTSRTYSSRHIRPASCL